MLRLVCRWLVVGISLLSAAPYLASQDLRSAAAQLAAKISERSTPAAVSVTIANRSSLSNDAVSTLRTELLRQLQSRGWRAKRTEEGGASINVTLSENFRGYVWTAEIFEAESRRIAIFEMPKPQQQVDVTSDRVALSRTLLISSADTLLDVTLLEGKIAEGTHLLTLTPAAIQLYQLQSSQWRLTQAQPLGREPRSSRDLRGRIFAQQASIFDAYLPGMHCTGVVTQTLSLSCRDSDDPWPLSEDRRLLAFYAANRNYFNGIMSGPNAQNGNGEPFYAAAVLSDRIVYSGVDGQARMVLPGQNLPVPAPKWGSNVTVVQSTCVPDLVLASAPGDFNQNDSVTAFSVSNSEFRAVSLPISFSGPVLNLNTSANAQQTVAVIESPSGRYEAYLLTARCSS